MIDSVDERGTSPDVRSVLNSNLKKETWFLDRLVSLCRHSETGDHRELYQWLTEPVLVGVGSTGRLDWFEELISRKEVLFFLPPAIQTMF